MQEKKSTESDNIKIKKFCSLKVTVKSEENKPQTGRRYSQHVKATED